MENENRVELKTNGRQALGRGLNEIEADYHPPRVIKPNHTETEEERTGEAIPAILRILSELPEAQEANVFAAVQAIRKTARRSSNEVVQIGAELTRIERDKAKREAKPTKRGWWR